MKRATALLALALLSSVTACRRESSVEKSGGSDTPLFIISIDTLRSDHLAAYGYRDGSTPAIDAFRRDAVLFTNAWSQVPQTFPSHASILTGLLPQHHAVRDNLGYVLQPSIPTLATMLHQHGYATGGAVSAYVLRKSTGISNGFDFYDDELEQSEDDTVPLSAAQRDGDRSRLALESWLEHTSSRRVFGFLHLYEPHAPYSPPPQFHSGHSAYDGEISYADSIVGKFFQTLRSRGLYDDAIIVLLSDHGEGLGEHGEDEHGIFLYRNELQVPLLIKLPKQKRAGETKTIPAALIDVMPTVLAELGMTSAAATDGIDLLNAPIPADRAIYSETYFPRFHLGWSELTSLVSGSAHYIAAPHSELYDVASDAAELTNRVAADRRLAASLRNRLVTMTVPPAAPSAVDPEEQRKLAALGYVGSTNGGAGALPDPKDQIGTAQAFRRGLEAFDRGDDRAAQQILQQLTALNPTFVDAWGLLARSYRRSRNDQAALVALKTAMTRFPGDPHVALALADVLYQQGKHGEARSHAELALRDEPALAREALAKMALGDGDLVAARSNAEAAVLAAPKRVASLMLLAAVLEKQQEWNGVLSALDRAAQIIAEGKRTVPESLQQRRGEALLHLQRVGEAEAAFRNETVAHPENADGWGNLAMIYAAQARSAEARQLVLEALQQRPSDAMFRMAHESAGVIADPSLEREIRARETARRP